MARGALQTTFNEETIIKKSLLLFIGVLTMLATCSAQDIVITNAGWFSMDSLGTLAVTNDSTEDSDTNQAQGFDASGFLRRRGRGRYAGVQALADGLQDDPVRIFNYVHDHIRHVLYFGSEGSGTDAAGKERQ